MRSSSAGGPGPRGAPPPQQPAGAPRAALVGFEGLDDDPMAGLGQAAEAVILDVTEATFERDIVTRSMDVPVVVDFWATWCQPCKTLSPVLEELAKEAAGQWVLAKVDVDKAPQLASYFQAQSIPLVIAIYQGNAIHSFTGAQPKAQVERWIAAIFQALKLPLHKIEKEPEAPTEPQAAEAFWRARLAKRVDEKARLALGRLLIARGEVVEAEQLLNAIAPGTPEFSPAQAALALKELVTEVGQAGGDAAVRARLAAAPDDGEARYLVAVADGAAGQFVKGLDVLVELVGTTKEPMRGRAKKAASMLFEAAGRGDEGVESARRRLTRLLF